MGLELGTGEVTKQQKIILGILAVVGFIYFYSSVFAPISGNIQEAEGELQRKRNELTEMRVRADQLDALEKEFEVLAGHLKRTEEHLPRSEELPEFIKTITSLAGRFDMDVRSLSVQSVTTGEYYRKHPYRMELSNDYHALGHFFAELGQLDRIFGIRNLNISGSEEGRVIANFDIVAYTFID